MLKFFAEKMWVAFAVQKLLTFFSAKKLRILYIESAKTVNEMTLNELVKLTTLWTTGPNTLGWNFSRLQFNIFLFFPETICHFSWRQFAWNVKICHLWNISADYSLKYSYFSQKPSFVISCKVSPMETICMKSQTMLSRKSKERNSLICRLLN